jgi:hypothetical protein
LRGLLPICASCKKIRDYQDYWTKDAELTTIIRLEAKILET